MSKVSSDQWFKLNDTQTGVRTMFLAQFAPEKHADCPPLHQKYGNHPQYQWEMFKTLQNLGLNVESCSDLPKFMNVIDNFEFVFTLYNRINCRNCEIVVPTLCEQHNVAYLGAPPNIRAWLEDKWISKQTARALGLKVPEGWLMQLEAESEASCAFDPPYFVKPRFGAASSGIDRESRQSSWPNALKKAASLIDEHFEVIVEQYINGVDLSVTILGGNEPKILGGMRNESDTDYISYEQKRNIAGGVHRTVFNQGDWLEAIYFDCLEFGRAVRPFDYLRLDFRINEQTQTHYFLEAGTCSNLGDHGIIAAVCKSCGIGIETFIEHVLVLSMNRQGIG